MDAPLYLFALDASAPFGLRVARHLGSGLAGHAEQDFDDGEFLLHVPAGVRGGDAYVIQSLAADLAARGGTGNDSAGQGSGERLCRLLFLVGALRDACAARVTAVLPYVAFARQDARRAPGEPLTLRYVATLLEAAGVDAVMALDVHNLSAFQNAFRCRTEHLDGSALFASHIAAHLVPDAQEQEFCIVAPDGGGIRRAECLREALAQALCRPVTLAFVEKHRHGGTLSGDLMAGDVAGKTAIVFDDIVGTGHTMARAVRACREQGATRVLAAATHAVFAGDAAAVLEAAGVDGVIVADTVQEGERARAVARADVAVLDSAALFAQAIRALHGGATTPG